MTVSFYLFFFNPTRLVTVMQLCLTADSTPAGFNVSKGAEIGEENNFTRSGNQTRRAEEP